MTNETTNDKQSLTMEEAKRLHVLPYGQEHRMTDIADGCDNWLLGYSKKFDVKFLADQPSEPE